MFIHVLCVCKNGKHKGEIFPCQHVHLYLSLGTTGWTFMKLPYFSIDNARVIYTKKV